MCFFVNTWNNKMQQELRGHWRCELVMSVNDMSKHGQQPYSPYSPWGLRESDMTERLSLSRSHSFVQRGLKKLGPGTPAPRSLPGAPSPSRCKAAGELGLPCLHRCTLNCLKQWLRWSRPLKCQSNSVSQSCQPKFHSWSWKPALQNQRIYQPPRGLTYCRGLRTKRVQAETLKKPFKNWSNRDFPSGPVTKTPNAGAPDLTPGQGPRSHMPQLKPSAAK